MELFSFEADPTVDLAIGTEASFHHLRYGNDGFCLTSADPLDPTGAKPGSEEKVRMLAARYAAGVPLWHDRDCYDHGPVGAGFFDRPFDAEEDEF
jgi:hypothetical protein